MHCTMRKLLELDKRRDYFFISFLKSSLASLAPAAAYKSTLNRGYAIVTRYLPGFLSALPWRHLLVTSP